MGVVLWMRFTQHAGQAGESIDPHAGSRALTLTGLD